MKNFGEKGEWAYPGTAQIFWVPPIIPGTGKATDFKFGQYIQRVHPNKSPLKILDKRERGCIQGLPNFFGYPLLSQEGGKLQISNLASTFRGSIRIKSHEKFGKKRERGRIQGLPNFFGYPLLSQERGKLRISNFACTFMGSIGTKAH